MNSSTLKQRRRSRLANAFAGAVFLVASSASPLFAQQLPEAVPEQVPAAPPGDRVGRLEQHVADLQAMVAALESLVRTQPSAVLPQESMAPGGQSFDHTAGVTARVDALETRIGALTSQLELLTQQLGQIEAGQSGGSTFQPLAPPPQGADPLEQLPELPGRQGHAPADPDARGQFKHAADAFLKGYTGYASGEKAPDTLLKLGMALAELGQKDAACVTLGAFSAKFPSVDQVLRDDARSGRRKAGCR